MDKPFQPDGDCIAGNPEITRLQEKALEAIAQGVLISDEKRRILYANAAFTRITGYRAEEMVGQDCKLLQGPGTDPDTRAALRAAVRSGQPFEGEILNYRKDGTPFWNALSISPIRDDQGRVIRFIGLQRDITERKNREMELRRLSEELRLETQRLHESQAVAGVGSWETNLSTLEATWTAETFRIFECRPDAFKPTHEKFLSFVHPADRQRVDEAFTGSIGRPGPFSIEHRLVFPDGRTKIVEERWQTFADATGRPTHAVGTCQDITQRKLAELATEQALQRLTEAQRVGRIGDWEWDQGDGTITWSPEVFEIYGRDPALGPPRNLEELCGLCEEADSAVLREKLERAITTGEPQDCEMTVRHPDGRRIAVHAKAVPRIDGGGRVTGLHGIMQDITDREEARAALAQSQDLLRIAGRIARLGGWSIDLPGYQLTWSDEVCLILDVMPGKTPPLEEALSLYPADRRGDVALHIRRCAEEGIPFEFEVEISTARQRTIWVKVSGEADRDTEGRIIRVHGALQDVSHQKQIEGEISRTNRALKMLSACNDALIRAENEEQLLNQICQIAVELGGYRMAWVGYARNDPGRSIEPAAHAGVENGYLAEMGLSWSAERPGGQGPSGRAVREGLVVTCEDIASDPIFAPRRESALRRGYRSLVALPLRREGNSFGVLGLYAGEAHTPAPDELKLLQELADNLAYGIGSLRSHLEARQGQEALLLTVKRMELAAKASKVGIWEWDIASGIVHWDEQMRALYGTRPDEPTPSYEEWQQQIHPDDVGRIETELTAALESDGRPFDTAFRITLPAGSVIRHIRAQALVLRDDKGRPTRMLGTNWDVTEQVEREEMLRRNLETERALRLLASAGERAKSEFVAVMSHEIRTPMNGVLGFAELLLQSPSLSAENRELVQTIVSSGEALLRILDDILDFSRLEAGRLTIENQGFSPGELIEGTRALFSRKLQEKGLRFVLHLDEKIPAWVLGDAGRIRQILVNLIGNAIKFTEEGSVTLTARTAHADSDHGLLEFAVTDTGPGIAPERAHAIFEAFTQEDSSTSRRHGGTGLGLTISRRLAELMGGTLELDPRAGPGATFVLRLPLVSAADTPETAQKKSESSPPMDAGFAARHPLRILVAEDDKVNLKLMLGILVRLGYTPLAARNGAEAVRMCEGEAVDCILMDLQMPEMDGMEATRKIREREHRLALPPVFIAALTANILPEDRRRCLQAGMNAYLNKPIKSQAITDTLREARAFRTLGSG